MWVTSDVRLFIVTYFVFIIIIISPQEPDYFTVY